MEQHKVGISKLFCQVPDRKFLGFNGPFVSVAATQLCVAQMQPQIIHKEMSHDSVPIELYLQALNFEFNYSDLLKLFENIKKPFLALGSLNKQAVGKIWAHRLEFADPAMEMNLKNMKLSERSQTQINTDAKYVLCDFIYMKFQTMQTHL